jgi:ornithine cyclodeaminase/alanine dehydrogenase-like protein (mu-crystallin family)
MILDERAVHDLLGMEELIPAMARAMADLSSGKVVQPGRVMLPVADHQGFLGLMPAYGGALGAKLVAFYPNNQGIPSHHAVILLFKPETGEPLVTMDGRLITEMRTAAVSAVATKLLARPEASVLGILGSGVQARSHLQAMRLVRTIRDVRVWSPRNAPAFAKEFGVRAVATAEEAVRGADIVVVATSSQTPVLSELDDEALRKARLYVEQREAATLESGDVIASGKIVAEIGEVVAGRKPGRQSPDEITLYKSVGVAVQDVVSADLVYKKALAAGIK